MLTLMRKENQSIIVDNIIKITVIKIIDKIVHLAITEKDGIIVEFTKYEGEGVLIDHEIKVKITRIKGKQSFISIGAPENVSINREEIQERIDNNVPQKAKGE